MVAGGGGRSGSGMNATNQAGGNRGVTGATAGGTGLPGGGGAGASRSSVTTSLAVTGQPTPTATGSAAAEGYLTITWIEP